MLSYINFKIGVITLKQLYEYILTVLRKHIFLIDVMTIQQ